MRMLPSISSGRAIMLGLFSLRSIMPELTKAVQSDYQTEQCARSRTLNGFWHVEHAEYLGKIKGIAVSLLKNQIRIGLQFIGA